MISVQAARELAAAGGWLSRTPEHFQQAVLERCHLQVVKAGETIFMVGDPPGGLYCLVSGSLRVSVAPGSDGPYFAHMLMPGTWAGEGPAITGGDRLVGLSAASESVLLHLPLPAFHELMRQDPGRWRFIAGLSFVNFATATGAIIDLMVRDDFKRVVSVLLRLGGYRAATPAPSGPIEIHISQEDIALTANLSRTTAGGILRQLEAEGLLELVYRRVVIRKPDKLKVLVAD